MKFKETFNKSKAGNLSMNSIYYYHSEDMCINTEFNFIIRFFENGQYAF